MQVYLKVITRLDFLQCLLHIAAIGFTHCPFHLASCGLRLDDEAVRVAVGLHLGAKLCKPHQCPCGAKVGPEGTHGADVVQAEHPDGTRRHHTLNDLVW